MLNIAAASALAQSANPTSSPQDRDAVSFPGTDELYTRPNPAAALPAGRNASEYWDITAQLESGYWIFARFVITNEGPGSQNGIAVGHVVTPEGRHIRFRNGRRRNRWQLSPDRLRLDVGRSHLDLHAPHYRLKVRKSHLKLDLQIDATGEQVLPSTLTPQGYSISLLSLGGSAHGSARFEGQDKPLPLRGHATLVHTVAQRAEADLVLRRIECFATVDGLSLYGLDFLGSEGTRSQWLSYVPHGPNGTRSDPTSLADPLEITLLEADRSHRVKSGKGTYWIPLNIDMNATNFDAFAQLERRLLRHRPLDDLPAPLRWLMGRAMQPSREWWQASFGVTLRTRSGPDFLQLEGPGVVATSYLNPLTR